jgi:geranylgeranyl pyrophosphate synthase
MNKSHIDLKNEFEEFLNFFINDIKNKKENDNIVSYLGDLFNGGKRLRPIIVLDVATYLYPEWRNDKNISSRIYNYALVLEIIHNTSLIIDDLPSMDNDIYRRDILTFHARYGQKATYLMTFNLLNLIKKILNTKVYVNNLNSLSLDNMKEEDKEDKENKDINSIFTENNKYIELEELINKELNNLVNGQKYDLDFEWMPLNNSRTLKIAELKTASLFILAFMGSYHIINNENKNKNNEVKTTLIARDYDYKDDIKIHLKNLGLNLGMAFQLSDDYLDLNTDKKENNYGLETSLEDLIEKYEYYHNKVEDILELLKFNKSSIIYEILNIMENRFTSLLYNETENETEHKTDNLITSRFKNKYYLGFTDNIIKKYGKDIEISNRIINNFDICLNELMESEILGINIWKNFNDLWNKEKQDIIIKILEFSLEIDNKQIKIRKIIKNIIDIDMLDEDKKFILKIIKQLESNYLYLFKKININNTLEEIKNIFNDLQNTIITEIDNTYNNWIKIG